MPFIMRRAKDQYVCTCMYVHIYIYINVYVCIYIFIQVPYNSICIQLTWGVRFAWPFLRPQSFWQGSALKHTKMPHQALVPVILALVPVILALVPVILAFVPGPG